MLKITGAALLMNPTKPHAKNLRKGRVSQPNQAYLITAVTANRKKVFADFYPARLLIHCLRQQHDLGQVESLAFVVMPDHLHWLMVLQAGASLSEVMRRVKGGSAYLINACRRQHEVSVEIKPLWQEGFHDHALRSEEDMRRTARYLVANPLRAGLVSKIGDYPHWDAKWLL
jgi:putative transposase